MKINKLENFKYPKISIIYDVIKKIEAVVTECNMEVGFIGLVKKLNNCSYLIYDVIVPKQEASGSTCEIDVEAISKIGENLMSGDGGLEKVNELRYWCHSHVNMCTSPSGQDENMALEFLDGADYLIRHIVNKKGEYNLSFFDFKTGLEYSDLELQVVNPPEIQKLLNEIEELTKAYNEHAKEFAKESMKNISKIQYKTGFYSENINDKNKYTNKSSYYDMYDGYDNYGNYYCYDWDEEDVLTSFNKNEIYNIACSKNVEEAHSYIEISYSTSRKEAETIYDTCKKLVINNKLEEERE